MSATLRAFYGALVGALAVLLIHPSSRPYVAYGLPQAVGRHLVEGLPRTAAQRLPEPDSLGHAARWAQTGCQRLFVGERLTRDEALLLVEIVQRAGEVDTDNAFWRQTEAVFQRRLGNEQSAIKAWRTASVASRWDDYQTAWISERSSGTGDSALSWRLALSKERETTYVQRVVSTYARQALRGSRLSDAHLRLATLRNGRLMRDGSKSVEGASMGVETIDFAAYASADMSATQRSVSTISPRRLIMARDALLTDAAFEGTPAVAEISDAFQTNDAWRAFISVDEAEQTVRRLTLGSILTSTLPGALIATGVFGGLVYLFGLALGRFRALQILLTRPYAQVLGVLGGLLVYWSNGLVFPAIWATVSLGSFGFSHASPRQAVPGGLGSAYSLAILLLALSFSTVLTLFFVGQSYPGSYLFEAGGFSQGFVSNPFVLVSLSTVIASLALVTGSVWGYLSRIPAERLAGPSVAKFGALVCLLCFGLGVVLAPPAIAVDRKISDPLSKIFQNEPTYYLIQ